MTDVAQLAGVSHTTVWRVFNNHRGVRDETRERVHHAIRQLGYRLNPAARTLVTRRSNTLGVITADRVSFRTTSILGGFERAARSAGYFVTITSADTPTQGTLRAAVNRLRDQGVEGVLALVPLDPTTFTSEPFPIVTIGARRRRALGVVDVGSSAGVAMATAHLLGLGHTTVHHVSGPPSCPEARLRRAVWHRTLRAASGRQPRFMAGDWTARSGYEIGLRLASDLDVTAVFCANDHMAIGVLRALTEMGRQVPEEVSVVGFDDIPEAAYTTPPLTTVGQDFETLGTHCMAMLHALVTDAERTVPCRIQLATHLTIRSSTARSPGSRSS
ncbi:LacI family DNA-binding transcriptional regulator [Phytohabitans kaempferiae]|uniref:LacI family DNA-binding transcriptional regulator n=1 Tax=Phytohabitans kaempferiae TaxID=1620943 RepID=A0ABV6M6G4_9ACTN